MAHLLSNVLQWLRRRQEKIFLVKKRREASSFNTESQMLLARLQQAKASRKLLLDLQLKAETEEQALKYDALLEALLKEEEALKAKWSIVDQKLRATQDTILQMETMSGIDLKEAARINRSLLEIISRRAMDYQAYEEESSKYSEELARSHAIIIQTGKAAQQISPTMALWYMKNQALNRPAESQTKEPV